MRLRRWNAARAGQTLRGHARAMSAAVAVVLLSLVAATALDAAVVVYSQGFESGDGSYTVSGAAPWQWGTPSGSGAPAAHSGTKCWATNISGTISPTVTGSLTSPAISVPSLGATRSARVSFWLYSDLATMTDRGEFQTSSNGST